MAVPMPCEAARAASPTACTRLPPPAVFPALELWQIDLDHLPLNGAAEWLAPSEIDKAGRFIFERDARRYRAAHVALRRLLAARFGLAPRAELAKGAHGKPMLPAGLHGGFNLSHSGPVALVAVGDEEGLGIDVECLGPGHDELAVAQQNFSESELAELHAAPISDIAHLFLRGWTRKEACLKAVGIGLVGAAGEGTLPALIEVGLTRHARRLVVGRGPRAVPVTVVGIDMGPGIVAAVAATDHHLGAAGKGPHP
jgi:4'-phosphopantetheinyl transferase